MKIRILLKRLYRKYVAKLDAKSEKIRIRKQWIAEHIKINKYMKKKIIKDCKLSLQQKKEVDSYFEEHYGKKVSYKWHQMYYAFSGHFDKLFFPEILYTTKLEPMFNPAHLVKAYADKNMLATLFSKVIKNNQNRLVIPQTIVGCCFGKLYEFDYNPISRKKMMEVLKGLEGECILKKTVNSSAGQDVRLVRFDNGRDLLSGETIESIIDEFGDNFVLQEKIEQNQQMKSLHPASVNTIRLMTYRIDEEIRCLKGAVRIGRGESFLDNVHAGGMYIAVKEDGRLGDFALDNKGNRYSCNPEMGYSFNEKKVPFYSSIIEVAKELHSCLPGIGFISWDFAINEDDEIVLIESNMQGESIRTFQNAHGEGIFGEDTDYMLNAIRRK